MALSGSLRDTGYLSEVLARDLLRDAAGRRDAALDNFVQANSSPPKKNLPEKTPPPPPPPPQSLPA